MASQSTAPGSAPQKKGLGVLGWILIGCGGLFVLVAVALVAGGFFVANKAKQAGLDPELMKSNPGLATAKMITALNPDLDLVNYDKSADKVTIRQKSTGKTVTVSLNELKQGKISFEDSEGKKVTVETQGEGESGSVKVTTPEGVAEWGTNVKVPGWVPQYPGATVGAHYSQIKDNQEQGTVQLTSTDSFDKVQQFYQSKLKEEGMSCDEPASASGPASRMQALSCKQANGRTVNLTFTGADQQVMVIIAYTEPK